MAAIIGNVTELDGTFFAKSSDGSSRELKLGDPVYEGETVVGSPDNLSGHKIIVSLDAVESEILIAGTDSQLFDQSLQPVPFSEMDVQGDPDTIAAMVDASEHIDEIETAAGEEAVSTTSTEDVTGDFQEKIDNRTNVEAELRPTDTQTYSVEENFTAQTDKQSFTRNSADTETLDAATLTAQTEIPTDNDSPTAATQSLDTAEESTRSNQAVQETTEPQAAAEAQAAQEAAEAQAAQEAAEA
ncbi:MAG: hypothetical protein U9Q62_00245, partial [Campylobacterota bacterium]|nr:hypothetical protein [Campylobacterota bacterium]